MVGCTEQDFLRITAWIEWILERFAVDFQGEALSYDNHSGYDYAFYEISRSAKLYWTPRLGYAPSDEALFRAFFEAEKRRLTRKLKGQPPEPMRSSWDDPPQGRWARFLSSLERWWPK